MMEGLTNCMGVAGAIGVDVLLTNVVKKVEDEDTPAAEKLANRAGALALSAIAGTAITKSMNELGKRMLEMHEKSIGLEVIGYIE